MQMVDLKIVSGGQTGVDRGALDAGVAWGLPVGGWCPAGRRAEDGKIGQQYPMRETPRNEYLQRTQWNARDSDGTLILMGGEASPGTVATRQAADEYGRPLMQIDWEDKDAELMVAQWMQAHGIRILNIAGPRESEAPGAYRRTRRFLDTLFAYLDQLGIE